MAWAIRILTLQEWPLAYEVIHQLRPAITADVYLTTTARLVQDFGFVLVAAFDTPDRAVGAMGYRPLLTYARGHHLHIDDLVTHESYRRQGVGRALLTFAEEQARLLNIGSLVLDARPGTEPFYITVGFEKLPPQPMKRILQPLSRTV